MIFLESLMPVNCQFRARFIASFMPDSCQKIWHVFVTVSWKFFEKNLCPFLLQFLPVFMPDFCHFFASIFCHNAGQFLARSGNFPGTLPENCQIWHKLLQGYSSILELITTEIIHVEKIKLFLLLLWNSILDYLFIFWLEFQSYFLFHNNFCN